MGNPEDFFNKGRYGCRWDGDKPSRRLHTYASPSHEEGAWCQECNLFEPLNAFSGGYNTKYLTDSYNRYPQNFELDKRYYEELGDILYTALKEVQQAIHLGEDENDEQIEQALQSWERRFLPKKEKEKG
jgi:hypothetical protein